MSQCSTPILSTLPEDVVSGFTFSLNTEREINPLNNA